MEAYRNIISWWLEYFLGDGTCFNRILVFIVMADYPINYISIGYTLPDLIMLCFSTFSGTRLQLNSSLIIFIVNLLARKLTPESNRLATHIVQSIGFVLTIESQ